MTNMTPTPTFNRAALLTRGARVGAGVLAASTAGGVFAATAAADPLSASDIALVRLLVGVELLTADFYAQAIAASNTTGKVKKYLAIAANNEQEHYTAVSGILTGAGIAPATSADFDFSYPRGTFATEAAIVAQAVKLEGIALGAYLGALTSVQAVALNTVFGSVAAAEAQHQGFFSAASGGRAFSLAFPPALKVADTSNALDAYTA